MQSVDQVITIFFSTTNDPGYAERRAAFNRAIRTVEESRGVAIRVLDWQENIPGGVAGATGQDRIDEEVYNKFDIYFGCLGPSFGAGTIREFENALEGHIERGRPSEVLFAFDETQINPFQIPDRFDQVIAFRKDIQTDTKYGRSVLYFAFDDPDKFQSLAFRDLNNAVRRLQTRVKGGLPPAS